MVYTFIGKAHFPDDPRLYHRIASELKKRQVKINWIDFHNRPSSDDEITYHHPDNLIETLQLLRVIPSDVIQISDPREWIYGIATRMLSNAKLVYDSHEDYYGQHTIMWHQTNNPLYFFSRYVLWFLNLFCASISHVTWSTDEFGTKHLKSVQKNTHFLPNYVRTTPELTHKASFADTDPQRLNFLYVGSYNAERGLTECLSYISKYNRKFKTDHHLSIYGLKEKFPDTFMTDQNCSFYSYLPLNRLYGKMLNYDIGVCLWQKNPKHYRNIPIKILEYMALGLPVLTSDFGYMKKYVVDSNSGIGISPTSYDDFERALKKFEDPENLTNYSRNGLNFTQRHTFNNIFARVFKPLVEKIR